MAAKKGVLITPDSKVGEILDAYPHLEDVLLELSPAFQKLRNPVLRKTVAKVASLRQAAKVGGIGLTEFINRLRQEAGIEEVFSQEIGEPAAERQPEWWEPKRITVRLDTRPILERGEKPLGRVMGDLDRLGAGEIYELTAGFFPAPLVDMARAKGFEVWSVRETPELVRVYFFRVTSAAESNGSSLVELL